MAKLSYTMRDLIWMGSSLEDLSSFPKDVKRAFGHGLREVQKGLTPPTAKPLPQFGTGIFELRDAFEGNAYRAVYAVRLVKAVYVLHAFKKKSKSGKAIPRPDIKTIERRSKNAHDIDRLKE